MEITTILGVIVGVVAVVGAMIFKHIEFSVLMNPAAFFCYYCRNCRHNFEFISRAEY